MGEQDDLKKKEQLLEVLRLIPSLEPFEGDDLKSLIKFSQIKKYKPGDAIMKEGSYDGYVYFLIQGRVRVSKDDKEVIMLERRGELFGEMSIMGDFGRSASVHAEEASVCLAIDTSKIESLAGNDRLTFCYILYRIFAENLAYRLKLTTTELVKVKGKKWKLW